VTCLHQLQSDYANDSDPATIIVVWHPGGPGKGTSRIERQKESGVLLSD